MGMFTHLLAYSLGQSSGRQQAERRAEDERRAREFKTALAQEPAKDKIAARAVADALVGTDLSDHGKEQLRAALDREPTAAAKDAAIISGALAAQRDAKAPPEASDTSLALGLVGIGVGMMAALTGALNVIPVLWPEPIGGGVGFAAVGHQVSTDLAGVATAAVLIVAGGMFLALVWAMMGRK